MPDFHDDDDGPRYASKRQQYSRTGRDQSTWSKTAHAGRPPSMATTDHLRARGLAWWISPGLRFSLAGFPVHLSWSIVVFAVLPLLDWLRGAQLTLPLVGVWVVAVVLSILVHELGHAMVARRYRLEPVSVTVHGIGGYCQHQSTPDNVQRVAIALAGPAAGLALAAVAYGVGELPLAAGSALVTYGLDALVWVGVLWSGLNLLPIVPLDGGNALAAILRDTMPRLAMPVVWGVGLGTALVASGVALVWGEFFITVLALLFAYENGRALWRWRAADRPRRK